MKAKSTLILIVMILTTFPAATCPADQHTTEDIEAYIAKTRERIENRYDDLIYLAERRAQYQIRNYRAWQRAQLYETAIYFKDYAYVHYGYILREDRAMFPAWRLSAYHDRIYHYTNRIEDLLGLTVIELKRQRDHALNNTIPYLEKRLIEDINKPKPAPNLITGIAFSCEKQFVIIGSKILQPQDTIKGAKIIKITPDSIVFQKQNKTWTQKIGQSIINH